MKSEFKGIEDEETNIPEWHKDLVRERLADYEKNPAQAIDFDEAMDDIERMLSPR